MDLIRSCYKVDMRFDFGGPLVEVFWFRTATDARVYPFPHSFGSLDSEEIKTGLDIGEIRPPRGEWQNGQRPARLTGVSAVIGTPQEFYGPAGYFQRAAAETIAIEACGLACKECGARNEEAVQSQPYEYNEACGGLRWVGLGCPIPLLDGTRSDIPVCASPGCSYPFLLRGTWPSPQGCPVLDGTTINLMFDFSDLKWHGTQITTGGKILKLTYDCSVLGQPQLEGTWTTHGILVGSGGGGTAPVFANGFPPWPLPVSFSNAGWTIQGAECGGPVSIVIDVP